MHPISQTIGSAFITNESEHSFQPKHTSFIPFSWNLVVYLNSSKNLLHYVLGLTYQNLDAILRAILFLNTRGIQIIGDSCNSRKIHVPNRIFWESIHLRSLGNFHVLNGYVMVQCNPWSIYMI